MYPLLVAVWCGVVWCGVMWLWWRGFVRSFPAAKLVVVGGGAGGVELALAMQYRLKQLFRESGRDPDAVVVEIVNRGDVVLSSHNRSGPSPTPT